MTGVELKILLSLATSKNGKKAIMYSSIGLIILTIVLMLLPIIIIVGIIEWFFPKNILSEDIFYIAKMEIREELQIENYIATSLVKASFNMKNDNEPVIEDIKLYIVNFLITKDMIDEKEILRFKTQEEVYISLKEHLGYTEEDILFVKEIVIMAGDIFLWPVPSNKNISSDFGEREDPTGISGTFHYGIDIPGDKLDVVSSTDGTVIFAGEDKYFGNLLKIEQGNKIIYYAHNSELLVKQGDKIKQGQLISKTGATGNVTGSHLHLEVHIDGKAVDPIQFFE